MNTKQQIYVTLMGWVFQDIKGLVAQCETGDKSAAEAIRSLVELIHNLPEAIAVPEITGRDLWFLDNQARELENIAQNPNVRYVEVYGELVSGLLAMIPPEQAANWR